MANDFDAKSFLRSLPHQPGVYCMYGADDTVLYVGKARDLSKRVASYFGSKAHHPKTMALMEQAQRVTVTVTASEKEALLLELNLIKQHQPHFNILLRDGKAYPYIYVNTDDAFPRFSFYRGQRKGRGRYLGPYPNSTAVRETLTYVQKLFRVRSCEDSVFANRTRPCLQHQIGRCSAPCVQLIDAAGYARDVRQALLFLEGRDTTVMAELAKQMDAAAEARDYETAAVLRDRIAGIKSLHASQVITGERPVDADAIAVVQAGGAWAVNLVLVRGGRVLGGRSFFPRARPDHSAADVMAAFLSQHYVATPAPREVLVNVLPEDLDMITAGLNSAAAARVTVRSRVRSQRRAWLEMAEASARIALESRQAGRATVAAQLQELGRVLALPAPPQRIECFDISHTAGENTVASCVVFGPEGPRKTEYRQFNIQAVAAGDDYAAMSQAIRRRYSRVTADGSGLPELVLVDGGHGQLQAAAAELQKLGLDALPLVAVSKGPGRKPGLETLHLQRQRQKLRLPEDSAALHLVQRIRDEAHRFAVARMRGRRSREGKGSALDAIPGIGATRKRALLRHFGGLQGIREAGVQDLRQVKGISKQLAESIFDAFH